MSAWLRLRLLWKRQSGACWGLAALLLVNALGYAYWLPATVARNAAESGGGMFQMPDDGLLPIAASQRNLEAFRQTLASDEQAEKAVADLFALAAKHGLSLEEASYERIAVSHKQYRQLQVTLPVTGSYPAIRQFSEAVLLRTPFAALDKVSFRRDQIEAGTVSATLGLVFFMRAQGETAQRTAGEASKI